MVNTTQRKVFAFGTKDAKQLQLDVSHEISEWSILMQSAVFGSNGSSMLTYLTLLTSLKLQGDW